MDDPAERTRRQALLDASAGVADLVGLTIRDRILRALGVGRGIAELAVAAALAWLIAQDLLDHPRPLLAAVTAIVALGVSREELGRRTFESVLGVVIGFAVAEVLVSVTGIGPLQILVISGLAMFAAALVSTRALFIGQAGTASVVVINAASAGSFSWDRIVDPLIGGAVALVIGQILSPPNTRRVIERAERPLFEELSTVLAATAAALEANDPAAAEAVLEQARALSPRVEELNDAVAFGHRARRVTVRRLSSDDRVLAHDRIAFHLDHAVRNVRVLARLALRATRRGAPVPSSLPASIVELARAVELLESQVFAGGSPAEGRLVALHAAQLAGRTALAEDLDLAVAAVASQVHSMVVDLLRASGMRSDDAIVAVEAVAAPEDAVGS